VCVTISIAYELSRLSSTFYFIKSLPLKAGKYGKVESESRIASIVFGLGTSAFVSSTVSFFNRVGDVQNLPIGLRPVRGACGGLRPVRGACSRYEVHVNGRDSRDFVNRPFQRSSVGHVKVTKTVL
jgi:hypothetical protein